MSIKYAVLGLIAEVPRHGYAVRAAFEDRLGDFWELNYGQIYQVLAALEAEGFIAGTDEQVGRRPRRTVYTISAKGRDALRAWLALPASAARPFRDDFYVKLLFINHDREALTHLLKARADACDRRVADLVDQHRSQVRTTPEGITRWLFTEAAIMHAEADRKSAALCSKILLENLGLASNCGTHRTDRIQRDEERPQKVRVRP